MPEGVVGTITAIDRAPQVERGPGRVVLTTVNHLNSFVFNLTLKNATGQTDTLGVTGYHKFYDEAEGWQSVCDLTIGDTLRGRDGNVVTVAEITRDAGVHRVYNMTVETDHVYFVGDLTTLTHNNNCNAVFGELDHLGRPTGVMVDINRNMIGTGTHASQSIRPPAFGGGVSNHARGHLWGRQLGGPGDDARNLVTLFQNQVNSPVMSTFEGHVRAAIEAGESVRYWAVPIYRGDDLMPIAVTLRARGTAGFSLDVSVLNRVLPKIPR